MGAGLGKRLVENGLEVRTSLVDRSNASADRARDAGMIGATGADLVNVDMVLSVVPPSQALLLAEQMAKSLKTTAKPPLYVDCNAVNPKTTKLIAQVIEGAGCSFVDGGIIGGPPREGYAPKLYVSGPWADKIALLNDYGFVVPVLAGPIGAASALKMSYSGITKGLIALGATMILAAESAGAGEALHQELSQSQAKILANFGGSIPSMISKSRRWAPEMEQIAGFVAEHPAAEQVYNGFGAIYERLADDLDGDGNEISILKRFVE